jgi:hypothetical protein
MYWYCFNAEFISFFNLFLVPLYNLRNWYGNIILFIYLILFFITTRTFVKFIFHSKFIEPSINTHIVKHCDGINMFSSSDFLQIQHFFIFWFISRYFGTSITILFLQRFKTQSREIFLKNSIVNLLILFQRRIYHYFEHITFNVLILFQRRIYFFF